LALGGSTHAYGYDPKDREDPSSEPVGVVLNDAAREEHASKVPVKHHPWDEGLEAPLTKSTRGWYTTVYTGKHRGQTTIMLLLLPYRWVWNNGDA